MHSNENQARLEKDLEVSTFERTKVQDENTLLKKRAEELDNTAKSREEAHKKNTATLVEKFKAAINHYTLKIDSLNKKKLDCQALLNAKTEAIQKLTTEKEELTAQLESSNAQLNALKRRYCEVGRDSRERDRDSQRSRR